MISLRFDDSVANDWYYTYPELTERGLVAGFACYGAKMDAAGGLTTAQALTMQENGMEIMCHSRTHGTDPADLAEFTDESVTYADEMRADGFDIHMFVQPGTWSTAYPDGYNITSGALFWGSAEDQLLRANFDCYEGYISMERQWPRQPADRYGPGHSAGYAMSLAQLQTAVDRATYPWGQEFLFHTNSIGGEDNISVADFESFLDYLAAAQTAGLVDVVIPSVNLCPELA